MIPKHSMLKFLRSALAILIVLPLGLAVADDDFAEIYRQATAAYDTGSFSEAIVLYEQLISENRQADSLYLNLGSSFHRNGSPGRAALWYRRASHLTPGMSEVQKNFEVLRKQQRILEFSDDEWKTVILKFSPQFLRWFKTLFFWSALFSMLIIVFSIKHSIKPVLAIIAFFAGAGAVFTSGLLHYRAHHLAPENYATIIGPEVSALIAPASDSLPVISLPAGSEIRVIQRSDPWLYASIPGNLVGWIPSSAVETNWPLPN